jgi:hypothetical protein
MVHPISSLVSAQILTLTSVSNFQHFQQAAKHERFGSTDAMRTKELS